jgi:hypothetical protein
MLTPKIREALEAELQHLRIRREQLVAAINDRIRALEAVLQPEAEITSGPYYVGLPDSPKETDPTGRQAASPLAGKGLRESIRLVLSHYPTGLLPSDVAARLQEMGFTPRGSLSVAKRVYGELYRMRQKGMVSKRGRRYMMSS